jgi:hypothetical protein
MILFLSTNIFYFNLKIYFFSYDIKLKSIFYLGFIFKNILYFKKKKNCVLNYILIIFFKKIIFLF